jgi:predicted nucleic acid-binding Zn ribbon protein
MSENEKKGIELARAALRAARSAARNTAPSVRRQRRRPPGEPLTLGESISGLVSERGWKNDVAVNGVLARWPEIVGEEVAAHVTPSGFVDGVLTLQADSTAWATQVRLLAPEFLKRLAAEVGDGVVKRIESKGPAGPSWRKGPRTVPGRGPRDTYG